MPELKSQWEQSEAKLEQKLEKLCPTADLKQFDQDITNFLKGILKDSPKRVDGNKVNEFLASVIPSGYSKKLRFYYHSLVLTKLGMCADSSGYELLYNGTLLRNSRLIKINLLYD